MNDPVMQLPELMQHPELMQLPELLSPCGSPEALDAAIDGGADAVYLGGRLLNARMRARNFTDNALSDAVVRCHRAGVKLYVTLNTIVFDRECDEAVRYAFFLYNIGVDALIVADLGLAMKIHSLLPDFELHASTQCSGHNTAAAGYLAGLGFSRMVAARELSENDLRSICASSPLETEIFVHGALCVSHSGQCLCSWALGGRSGNRGECAQPCRMKYGQGYPLSLKDNCLARHIPALIEMGASSLKLEGRLKPPDYVYAVTRTYRTLLDERRGANDDEVAYLAEVFSRGGFTDGYFTSKIGPEMLGVRGDEESRAVRRMAKPVRRVEQSDILSRTEALPPDEKIKFDKFRSPKIVQNTARFYNKKEIPKSAHRFFDRIYLPLADYEKLSEKCDGVMLPPVIPDSELGKVREMLAAAYEKGARHALVGNIGHIAPAEECGYVLHGDYRLNIANCGSAKLHGDRFEDYILSPELMTAQIRDITGAKAVIVYGRIPLMTLEKPVDVQSVHGMRSLRGAKGEKFAVIREGGRDLLLNPLPIYMADRGAELKEAFISNRHFVFTVESSAEVSAVIDAYIGGKAPADSSKIKRIK